MLVLCSRFAPSVWTWGRTCLWVPWVRTSCWRSSPRYPETTGPLTFMLTHLSPHIWGFSTLHQTIQNRTELDLIFRLYYWYSVCEFGRTRNWNQPNFAQCEFWFWLPGIFCFWCFFLFFYPFIGGPVLFLLILLHILHCLSTKPIKNNVLAQNYQRFSVIFYIQSEWK